MDVVNTQTYSLTLGPKAMEELRLEAAIEKRVAEIEKIQLEIQTLDDALKEKSAKEIEEIQRLCVELEGIMTAARGESVNSLEEAMKATREHNKKMEEQGERGKKAPSARAKELFAKIAQKTHPDKTEDPGHHALFEYARKARDRDDIEELSAILKTLGIQAGRAFISKLVPRLDELRARDEETRAALAGLLASDQYKIMQDYKNPAVQQYVERHYRDEMCLMIEKVKDKIRALDPTRYVKQVKWPNFSEIFKARS